jgi:hypothetical protein
MKTMRLLGVALLALPAACAPQKPAAPPTNPVAEAARSMNTRWAGNLMEAADSVPAAKLSYAPTKEQMPFGKIWNHLAEANYGICGAIGGTPGPKVPEYTGKESKDTLVASLQGSFTFCNQALANLADSTLNDQVDMGFMKGSKALALDIYLMDLADHYSQVANYMRLNGMLPPSARKKMD